jgi:type IV pilus assembly protein PilC
MATKKPDAILTFGYEALDRKGQKIKGEITGTNIALAKAQLRKQGFNVQKISKKNSFSFGKPKGKISPMDVAIFTRQLATMMKAGVPLVQSFEIVAEGLDNAAMREVVMGIKSEVEGGGSFTSALRKYPLYFDELFCSLVESGEQSGALETMLDRVADYKEKSELLKQKIKKAMKYPMSVIVVAIIVTVILLLKVVPVFQSMFEGFGAQLPAFTMMVVNMSKWLQANWFYALVIVLGIGGAFGEAKKRSKAFNNMLDRLALKAPIVGDLVYKSTVARFARTLATTFAAGVPLVDALVSCAGATGNVVYRDAVMKIKDEVSSGQQLGFSMRQSGIFPLYGFTNGRLLVKSQVL